MLAACEQASCTTLAPVAVLDPVTAAHRPLFTETT